MHDPTAHDTRTHDTTAAGTRMQATTTRRMALTGGAATLGLGLSGLAMSSRAAAAGTAAVSAGTAAGMAAGTAAVSSGAAPSISWFAVTSSRVAVLVSGATGSVQVRSGAGQVLATGTALSGTVMLTVTVPQNGQAPIQIWAGGRQVTATWVSATPYRQLVSPWRVANKRIALSPYFAPSDLVTVTGSARLRKDCAAAYGDLRRAAQAAGHPTGITSAYRSYSGQAALYSSYVRSLGRTGADRQCARAGHSEHQLGLSIDLVGSVGTSALAQWVAANGWRYGFIVRYPRTATAVTGIEWEPWHVRYVGPALAADFTRRRATALETYFGLPAAPTY